MTGRRVCQFLQSKPPPADIVEQNIEAVRCEAHEKRPEDMLDFGEVYNYAGQYMQYFDMQVFPHLFSPLGQCPEIEKKKHNGLWAQRAPMPRKKWNQPRSVMEPAKVVFPQTANADRQGDRIGGVLGRAAPVGSQLFTASPFVLADGLCENALHARLR